MKKGRENAKHTRVPDIHYAFVGSVAYFKEKQGIFSKTCS